MNEEIGKAAGRIWSVLDEKGELSVTQLKKEVAAKAPYFDWAIGWLAREDKIVIASDKRSFRISLRERAGAAGAARA
jgi:Winged helix-turn-helix domain (DUF2582)